MLYTCTANPCLTCTLRSRLPWRCCKPFQNHSRRSRTCGCKRSSGYSPMHVTNGTMCIKLVTKPCNCQQCWRLCLKLTLPLMLNFLLCYKEKRYCTWYIVVKIIIINKKFLTREKYGKWLIQKKIIFQNDDPWCRDRRTHFMIRTSALWMWQIT